MPSHYDRLRMGMLGRLAPPPFRQRQSQVPSPVMPSASPQALAGQQLLNPQEVPRWRGEQRQVAGGSVPNQEQVADLIQKLVQFGSGRTRRGGTVGQKPALPQGKPGGLAQLMVLRSDGRPVYRDTRTGQTFLGEPAQLPQMTPVDSALSQMPESAERTSSGGHPAFDRVVFAPGATPEQTAAAMARVNQQRAPLVQQLTEPGGLATSGQADVPGFLGLGANPAGVAMRGLQTMKARRDLAANRAAAQAAVDQGEDQFTQNPPPWYQDQQAALQHELGRQAVAQSKIAGTFDEGAMDQMLGIGTTRPGTRPRGGLSTETYDPAFGYRSSTTTPTVGKSFEELIAGKTTPYIGPETTWNRLPSQTKRTIQQRRSENRARAEKRRSDAQPAITARAQAKDMARLERLGVSPNAQLLSRAFGGDEFAQNLALVSSGGPDALNVLQQAAAMNDPVNRRAAYIQGLVAAGTPLKDAEKSWDTMFEESGAGADAGGGPLPEEFLDESGFPLSAGEIWSKGLAAGRTEDELREIIKRVHGPYGDVPFVGSAYQKFSRIPEPFRSIGMGLIGGGIPSAAYSLGNFLNRPFQEEVPSAGASPGGGTLSRSPTERRGGIPKSFQDLLNLFRGRRPPKRKDNEKPMIPPGPRF